MSMTPIMKITTKDVNIQYIMLYGKISAALAKALGGVQL